MRKTSGLEVNKRVQSQNQYETLQEDKTISNADQQVDLVKEKLQADQPSD